jgi:hypothetical protein
MESDLAQLWNCGMHPEIHADEIRKTQEDGTERELLALL